MGHNCEQKLRDWEKSGKRPVWEVVTAFWEGPAKGHAEERQRQEEPLAVSKWAQQPFSALSKGNPRTRVNNQLNSQPGKERP